MVVVIVFGIQEADENVIGAMREYLEYMKGETIEYFYDEDKEEYVWSESEDEQSMNEQEKFDHILVTKRRMMKLSNKIRSQAVEKIP